MTLYVKRQLRITVSDNRNGDNPFVSVGANEESYSDQAHSTKTTDSRIVIAAGAVDTVLPMGSGLTTGRGLYIESDQDITIKLGGTEADRAIALKLPATDKKARAYLDAEFTSLNVSNAGATEANVYYAVIGA